MAGTTTGIGIGTGVIGVGIATTIGTVVGIVDLRSRKTKFGKNKSSAKTKPRASGALSSSVTLRSDRAAAASAPDKSRATAAAGHNDDRALDDNRSRHDHDAIGTAVAIGTAMHARTATAFCIGGAKAGHRACDQNCCEKVFHVLSRFEPTCGVSRP
jgi:hypothetical protein